MSHLNGGNRTPSLMGSKQSVYSHSSSTVRTFRTGPKSHKIGKGHHHLKWYQKPLMRSAIYTDLQRGAWHIAFYALFLSIWTIFTSGFDIYCLHEATPGSSHTGYYIISFDFVYVGNAHIRNLLIMSSVFSLFGGIALIITTVLLLDGLRKEQETAFKGWLFVMGIFTPWKILDWGFDGIVNDMIFAYNIIMLIAWFFFNIANVFSFLCVYSLYLELNDLTKLQDLARLKTDSLSICSRSGGLGPSRPPSIASDHYSTLSPIRELVEMDTMSSMAPSRAASTAHGSRPTSPYVVNMQHGGHQVHHPQRHY